MSTSEDDGETAILTAAEHEGAAARSRATANAGPRPGFFQRNATRAAWLALALACFACWLASDAGERAINADRVAYNAWDESLDNLGRLTACESRLDAVEARLDEIESSRRRRH